MTPSRRRAVLPSRRLSRRLSRRTAAALGVALLLPLAACGGDGGTGGGGDDGAGTADATGSAPGSATPSAPTSSATGRDADYLEVPSGVTLTQPGARLALGDVATIAWRPAAERVGVLAVRVTAVQPAPAGAFDGWLVGGADVAATPYFVTTTVENVGEGDLAGQDVPLYLLRDDAALVPASRFGAEFPACPSTALPAPFGPGASATQCQVHLAADGTTVEGLAFQPWDGLEPVVWEVAAAPAPSTPSSAPGTP
ncbi:hypothetical protein INN71_05095 [Nocardioides sp. ChNu-153]|uniref:hypothetical protein n=1 Tax=Nocardioides sp. ChNu-153 TaxID=2779364 RepID=UPI0026555B7C|nr:hypothetical protein [Nocardioides sp. ChNu-153]MDN7120765.1 hypothetical protein [Nocardioides sp. ChNu-153]